jgi:hypothetical protein
MEDDHRPFARRAQLLDDIAAVRRRETVRRRDENSRRKVQIVREDSWADSSGDVDHGTDDAEASAPSRGLLHEYQRVA